MLPPLGAPGPENTTVTPIPGDVRFFGFDASEIGNPAYGPTICMPIGSPPLVVPIGMPSAGCWVMVNG